MDFLRIRNEARARAASKAEGAAEEPSAVPAPAAPPAGLPRRDTAPPALSDVEADVDADADALEGALAARLRDAEVAEAADGAPPAPPPAFTTWRPGSGAPPPVPAQPARSSPAVNPADFAMVRPGAGPPAAPPARATAEEPGAPPLGAAAPAEAAGAADPLDGFFYDPEEPPLPGELGQVPARPEPVEERLAREEYLTFLLGAEEYAVAIERVREVLKCPPVTEVPRAPAHILGVVTVRGEVVAVFDPRRRLGLPHAPPVDGGGRMVIVDAGEGPCGLVVDSVASVVRLRPGSVEPCPQGIGGASQEYLAGIGREGDRLFTVLDLGALLRRPLAPGRRVADGRAHVP